jgi:proline iminopeptidase
MGYRRGGWYSYDWLDNWGRRSATKILPEFQEIKPGDFLPTTPNGRCGFEVLEAEPARHLVLAANLTVRPMRSLPWSEPPPPVYMKSTWTFVLEPGERTETRLLVRARAISAPAWRWFIWNAFGFPAHLIMQRKQLLNLRDRVRAGLAGGRLE